jgi:hypothetical protein
MLHTHRCSSLLRATSRSIRSKLQDKARTHPQVLQRDSVTVNKSKAPTDPPLDAVQKGTLGFGFSAGEINLHCKLELNST